MSLVLAVEPDAQQAEILRRILCRQDYTELIVVASAYAATSFMRRRVPDVVLVSASLGSKAQEIVDIFCLVSDVANPQTLRIPPLRAANPEVFAAEVAACVGRTAEQRQRTKRHEAVSVPAPHASIQEEAAPAEVVVAESDAVSAPAANDVQVDTTSSAENDSILDHSILINLDSATSGDGRIDPDIHAAYVAFVQARAEARLAEELERVRREAAEEHAAELARLQQEAEAQRCTEVVEARAAAAAEARDALSAELARVRSEAEATLAAELARVRAEAAERLAAQLAEADRARAAAVDEARVAAERSAAEALQAEVVRINAENETRLAAELRRVHEEAERARHAQERTLEEMESVRDAAAQEARAAAEEAAAQALAAEVARVRDEADARLDAELSRAHAEADAARRAQQQAQVDLDAARDAAAREARAAAEDAAARALEAEVARVHAEAEARLQQELARVRAEVDELRRAREQAQLDADAAREAAVREAIAAAEAAVAGRERARAGESAEPLRVPATGAVSRKDNAAARVVSAKVLAAAITVATAARLTAQIGGRMALATTRAIAVVLRTSFRGGRAALPAIRAAWERLPARTLPAAAILLLVAGAGTLVDRASLAGLVTSAARAATRATSAMLSRASEAVQPSALSRGGGRGSQRPEEAVAEPIPLPTEAAAPTTSGMLAVFSRVPLELYVSGRRIGTTEDGQILLPPGRYRVGLVNARLNYRGEVTLAVRSAEVTAHTVRLPDGHVQVNTEPGAEVWIEGDYAGMAPLGAVPVPIGTREVVVRHPDLGERREYVEVRHGETAQVTIRRRESVDPATAYPLPRLGQPGPPIR